MWCVPYYIILLMRTVFMQASGSTLSWFFFIPSDNVLPEQVERVVLICASRARYGMYILCISRSGIWNFQNAFWAVSWVSMTRISVSWSFSHSHIALCSLYSLNKRNLSLSLTYKISEITINSPLNAIMFSRRNCFRARDLRTNLTTYCLKSEVSRMDPFCKIAHSYIYILFQFLFHTPREIWSKFHKFESL